MSESAVDSAGPYPGPVDRIRGVAVPDTRLHPIYLVIETARTLRSAIPFLVVTFLGGAPWWVNVTLFVLIMIVATAQWYVRKYSVISGVLRLRSGLVNRTVRVVPITRITALDAYRSLSQRIVGVWGLRVQSPGDGGGAAVSLGSLSTSRLEQLQAALETVRPLPDAAPDPGGSAEAADDPEAETVGAPPVTGEGPASGSSRATDGSPLSAEPQPAAKPAMASILHRFSRRRRDPKRPNGYQTIAVLTTQEMLIAAVTNNSIPLIFAAALVVWYRFSEYVPSRAQDFMTETVEPRGVLAVVTALVVTAVVAGVVLSALRLNRFTLIRDGHVLRNHRGLLGKQTAAIPVARIQAVRVVEGVWRTMFGYASLQVEVAGIGRANTNQRMLFPLVRTAGAAHLVRRVLPELHWPEDPPHPIPERIHRRYLTVPLEYGMGFTLLLLLLLPGWWRLLALLPIPLAYWLGVVRAREARWWVGEHSVLLRWRRLLARNTVVAHRGGAQEVEWSSSPWKARARVAGFTMRFSSGRSAKIRYMADDDALMLTHVVGRDRPHVPGVPDGVNA